VQWLDNHDLVLMNERGDLTTLTTDPDRLLRLVKASVTRGLTDIQCGAYGFLECPDRSTLRGEGPTVPEVLRGKAFSLSWTPEELVDAGTAYFERAFGAPLDERSVELASVVGDMLAGDYRLEFGDSSYVLRPGSEGEVFCAGSVTTRGDQLLLGADRGSWCLDFHFAEVGWDLDGDQLRFPIERVRTAYLERLVLGLKPFDLVD
jgi:hypothetical protein